MTINFTDLKVKQEPSGNQGLSVSLTENVPGLPTPINQTSVNINTTTLSPSELATVNSFIALCKSKL